MTDAPRQGNEMSEEVMPTPLPWKIDAAANDCEVAGADGSFVADCRDVPGQGEANAALIVRAVNAHADLLAACEAVDALARELIAGLGAGSSRNRSAAVAGVATMFREKVQAAIAKATGAA